MDLAVPELEGWSIFRKRFENNFQEKGATVL
jgi:hypothetical protein